MVKVRLKDNQVEILEDLKPEEIDGEELKNFIVALSIEKNL